MSYWQQGKHWLFGRLADAGRDESAHHVCPALRVTNWHADHLAAFWAGFSSVGNGLLFLCLMSARDVMQQLSTDHNITDVAADDVTLNLTGGF